MLITAIPLSIAWVLTYGEVCCPEPEHNLPLLSSRHLTICLVAISKWEVLTFFVSVMGPAEVAAWGMLGFIWDTFEHITGKQYISCHLCIIRFVSENDELFRL